MEILFKELRFRNILSFGASETVIVFTKGINLICGKNGSGKSAILDALSFCLFGKPYRDIKIKDLINRRNKKEASVTCIFKNGENEYKITRTLNPESLTIVKNNNESDLLSSKKLNQEELNKIIGIDYRLFKQIISLAVNYNKPFLSLPIGEKREIIEQIFTITVFGLMLKQAKKINADNIVKNEMNINSINLLEEHLKTLRKNIKDIKIATKNFENNKNEELKDIDERIEKYKENINVLNDEIIKIDKILLITENLMADNPIKNLKKELDEINKNINNKEFLLANNLETIKNLENDIVCPRCKTQLTKEHKTIETLKLSNEVIVLQSELKTHNIERNKIVKEIEKIELVINNDKKIKDNKQLSIEKKTLLENELNHLKENRLKVQNKKLDFNLENNIADFNQKIEEYKTIHKNSKTIKKIIENYETVFSILSETGIKAFFFKKLIPILNTKINEYLRLFEIPVVLLFDEYMNEKITSYDNVKSNISYYSYSEGEKKRIDMSILLSFISITKSISNWNCNLLLIDELLDGAIDEAGLDKLVSSLKNMTYDSNLSIYIISHRLQQDYNSKFNKCLHLEKEDSFSKITYI